MNDLNHNDGLCRVPKTGSETIWGLLDELSSRNNFTSYTDDQVSVNSNNNVDDSSRRLVSTEFCSPDTNCTTMRLYPSVETEAQTWN